MAHSEERAVPSKSRGRASSTRKIDAWRVAHKPGTLLDSHWRRGAAKFEGAALRSGYQPTAWRLSDVEQLLAARATRELVRVQERLRAASYVDPKTVAVPATEKPVGRSLQSNDLTDALRGITREIIQIPVPSRAVARQEAEHLCQHQPELFTQRLHLTRRLRLMRGVNRSRPPCRRGRDWGFRAT